MSVIVLNDLSWCLALAESVNREFASVVKICLVYSIFPLISRKLDVEFYDSVLL